jgi:hypothetical protein
LLSCGACALFSALPSHLFLPQSLSLAPRCILDSLALSLVPLTTFLA